MMDRLSKAHLKDLRALRLKKRRDGTGRFIVEGPRACEAILAGDVEVLELLLTPRVESDERARRLADAVTAAGASVRQCTDEDLQSIADATHAQGVLAVCKWHDRPLNALPPDGASLVLALDRVADPGNVGTLLRAADWFGVDAVALGEGCADALNPKTVRASAGTVAMTPLWRRCPLPETLGRLRSKGFALVAASADGEPNLTNWRRERTVLILGNEAHGLSDETRALADELVAVPRRGRGESLNVAMAGVALLAAGLAGELGGWRE